MSSERGGTLAFIIRMLGYKAFIMKSEISENKRVNAQGLYLQGDWTYMNAPAYNQYILIYGIGRADKSNGIS